MSWRDLSVPWFLFFVPPTFTLCGCENAVGSFFIEWNATDWISIASLAAACILIGAYRDVPAERHKGAAYQHRCYLAGAFHRGGRNPPCLQHAHGGTIHTLDTDQGHIHWGKLSTTTQPVIPVRWEYIKIRKEESGHIKHQSTWMMGALCDVGRNTP